MKSRTSRLIAARVLVAGLTIVGYFSVWASTASAQTYLFGRADFAVGNNPVALVPGDLNGDGILDLAVANAGSNTVSILLGKPDGTFAPKIDYPAGVAPNLIATGDFNRDGKLDLAVTDKNYCTSDNFRETCGPGTVSILLGNGDGSFQGHTDYVIGAWPISVTVGDFNGDGKLDLATANYQDFTISVLLKSIT